MIKSNIKNQISKILSFICALLLFCSFALTKENYPQRIISLGPGITEELYLLGVENKLIANTVYCERPPEAQKKEKIGTVIKVDLEKIVSLEPDLVIATSLSNPEQVEKLKNLGIKVVTFPATKSFFQLCEQFLELAKLVGEEEKAARIIHQAKKEVDAIRKKVKDLPMPKVFVQVGAKPLFTVTKNSFVHDFIKFAGGINITEKAKSGLYSREKVLKSNPDIIIIVTMGIAGKEEKKIWQKYKTMKAVKNNRIHIIDSYKLCSPTPVTFVEALKEMGEILHPRLETD
ncbi:ABC transporter substrate-binding protein [bacterium]|nr:ABC transporter substrate-binding protein [bacterium]